MVVVYTHRVVRRADMQACSLIPAATFAKQVPLERVTALAMSALLEHYEPGLDSYEPRPTTRILFDRAWFGEIVPKPSDSGAYGYLTMTGTALWA